MSDLSFEKLALLAAFIFPGAISMYVFRLLVPMEDFHLKDRILEAAMFSFINFGLVWVPFNYFYNEVQWYIQWAMFVVSYLLAPILWPRLIVGVLRYAERAGWINPQSRTAWDEFFSKRRAGCWLKIELKDGRVVGGRFSTNSFASSFPEAGHIFIEEAWQIDESGNFGMPFDGSPGLLLRPSDYSVIWTFVDEERPDDEGQ